VYFSAFILSVLVARALDLRSESEAGIRIRD